MAKQFPYLSFSNAKTAIEYYEEVFHAKIVTRRTVSEEMAEQFGVSTENLENTTMHAAFTLLDDKITILCSDRFGSQGEFTDVHAILLDFNSEDENDLQDMKNLYRKIEASGTCKIAMPLAEQFLGGSMAQFIDGYGITWMLHSQPYSKLSL